MLEDQPYAAGGFAAARFPRAVSHCHGQPSLNYTMNDWRKTLLERQHWMTYLLPFLVFMLAGSLEPTSQNKPGGGAIGLAIPYAYYPWVYAAKIALTAAAVIFVMPGYRAFPWRLTGWGIVAGLVGGPLWIGLALLDWEHTYLAPLLNQIGAGRLVGGERAAYNPFEQLPGHPAWAWTFLAVRFIGLVALVPIIEEFFLRGWLMRFVMEREWWKVPFGKASALAIVLGTVMPMLSHPELLAAAVWFSMITWLMLRTRNIWDCVAAHVLTNLIMGIYAVATGTWQLM